eukprot:10854772-Heterocapsa_arctica.AAC.1
MAPGRGGLSCNALLIYTWVTYLPNTTQYINQQAQRISGIHYVWRVAPSRARPPVISHAKTYFALSVEVYHAPTLFPIKNYHNHPLTHPPLILSGSLTPISCHSSSGSVVHQPRSTLSCSRAKPWPAARGSSK